MKYRFLVIFLTCFGIASSVVGQITSQNNGAWNVGTTWVGGVSPTATDNVVITSNHVVDFNTNATCASLVIQNTGRVNFIANSTLTVTSDLTMTGNSQIAGAGNNHIVTVGGNYSVPAGQIATIGGVRFTITGTTLIAGYFQFGISGVGNKVFNNTITVAVGGTWDNLVGEDPRINCNIINNGSWPAPTGGTGTYQVSVNGTSYTYAGSQPIHMSALALTNGTGTTITNLGTLVLTRTGGTALDVGAGRTFINGDGIETSTLRISGTGVIINAGTIDFTRTNNTVDYIGAVAQSVFATTYYNLRCSTSGIKTLLGNTTVTNEVNVSGTAILDANTRTMDGTANLVMAGTSELRLSKTSTTLPELTGTANSLAAGTSITFNGADVQTAKSSSAVNPSTTNSYPYQNVNVNGNNALSNVNFSNVSLVNGNLVFTLLGRINSNPVMTVGGTFNFGPAATTILANNITVGNIIFSGGTLNYSNRAITVNGTNGSWTNNGGVTFVNVSSLVTFTTGTNQQIAGTVGTTFTNLTLNNSNGVTLNGVDVQVTAALTFTSGNLITGTTRNIYVPTGGSVAHTSGHIEGNLQKDVPIGSPAVTFEVGTGTTYSPVDLVFTTVGTAGILTVSATAGDHADINAANIEPTKTANRNWSLTNNGIAFTSYDATFNFIAGDLDGAATPANFVVKRSNGTNWFSTTTGTQTATSTQFTGEPSANLPATKQDFQCGETIPTTGLMNRLTGSVAWNSNATWIENRSGTITFNPVSTSATGVGTLFLTELADGDVLMLQTTAGTVQGTVAPLGRTSNTTLTLLAIPPGGVGGYGRQRIPNAVGDVVTIGNSNLADALTDIDFNMPVATTINSLDINTSASPRTTAQSVTHSVVNLLTVQTNVIVNQPGGSTTDAWNINAGSATVNGNLTLGTVINDVTRITRVTVTTGTLTTGNLIFNTFATPSQNELTAVLDMSGGAGRINVLGQLTFTNNLGRLIPGVTSTFNYQRSVSGQRINWPSANINATRWVYNNLRLNNTSTAGAFVQAGDDINITGVANLNVTGDIRIETGTMVTGNNSDITGAVAKTFQIDPGATFSMTGSSSTFPTGFGTFSLGTTTPFGTVSYEQSTVVTTTSPASGFGNLRVLNNAVIVTMPAGTTTVVGNLVVGNGTTTPIFRGAGGGGSVLTVTNDVTINANATLDANAGGDITTLNVGGNWTNHGTFTPSVNAGNAVVFTGAGATQPQTIGGTTSEVFRDLMLNTALPTHTVQLLKPISISAAGTSTLTLTQGGLDLNGNVLSVLRRSTGAIARTGGYIKSENTSVPYGTITWSTGNVTGSVVYPFGKSSTEYIPFTLNITSTGLPTNTVPTMSASTYGTATDNTPYPATVTNLNGTSGGNSVADRFWVITDNGYTTRPTVTVTFTAVGGNGATPPSERPATIADLTTVAANPAGIAAQRWNSAGYWDLAPAGQTFANNAPAANFFQVTLPGLNSFSPWTLVDVSTPLPIELTDFAARIKAGLVNVSWRTESELNNDYFVVQKTANAESFEDVAMVKGAGTTTTPKSYSTLDYQSKPGKWYYRLKQTDFDGQFSYSKLVAVDIPESLFWKVYPNPSSGSDLNISFTTNDIGKTASIRIVDLNGKEMVAGVSLVLDKTEVKLELNDPIPTGMYILSIAVDFQVSRLKVIVK